MRLLSGAQTGSVINRWVRSEAAQDAARRFDQPHIEISVDPSCDANGAAIRRNAREACARSDVGSTSPKVPVCRPALSNHVNWRGSLIGARYAINPVCDVETAISPSRSLVAGHPLCHGKRIACGFKRLQVQALRQQVLLAR